jgi:DNA polymerase zeta
VPVFDAKGIETVRRDGCAAQAKMTEQCLKYVLYSTYPGRANRRSRILFRTQDLSEVKDYCYDSWYKIIDQRVTVQDFIFAKEVKMGTYRCVSS